MSHLGGMFDSGVKLKETVVVLESDQRSGCVVHINLTDIPGEVKVRSVVDKLLWIEFECVGTPEMSSTVMLFVDRM